MFNYRPAHYPPRSIEQEQNVFPFPCLALGFRFLLKSSHCPLLPVIPCVLVELSPCLE